MIFAKRPQTGRNGKQIQVRSNFFPITTLPTSTLYHYELEIFPEVPAVKNQKIFHTFIDFCGIFLII